MRGESRDDKKRKLLDLLQKKVKSKKKKVEEKASTEPGPSNQIKDGHQKVQFGWLHYDPQQKRYVGVRLGKGGGTRTVSAKRSSDVHDLIALGKSIFFPGGRSFFGRIEDMISTLENFKGDQISFENFTLARYITSHALTTVRLYLMTRTVEKNSEECDTELPEVFEVDRKQTKVNAKKECHVDANHGGLVGTSAERETIKGQQDMEYKESLAADQAKEKRKLKIEMPTKRQLQLQTASKRRLPPEPAVNEANAVVSVRHVTLGILRWAFKATDEMSAVYDWIDSLSTKPESFSLSGCELPELEQNFQNPGEKVIASCIGGNYLRKEHLYTKRMCQMAAEKWLSCDHTFKGFANIGFWLNRRWVKLYDTLFIDLNEEGIVHSWKLCKGTNFLLVENVLKLSKERLDRQEKNYHFHVGQLLFLAYKSIPRQCSKVGSFSCHTKSDKENSQKERMY